MENILTIDVEEWYQTQSYKSKISISDWSKLENSMGATLEILQILRQFNIKATFFVLAYNAKRHPEIIRLIKEEGHEISLHGYYHNLVYRQSPLQFRKEIDYSKKLIEDICQTEVIGFRAPSWSVTPYCLWALDILQQLGFYYDSSMDESVFKKIYHKIPSQLLEIPRPTFRFLGISIPFAGGGTLRVYPYFVTKRLIRQRNNRGEKIVVYVHPWEFDKSSPPIKLAFPKKIIKDFHLGKTKQKLKFLLQDFGFNSIKNIFFINNCGGERH